MNYIHINFFKIHTKSIQGKLKNSDERNKKRTKWSYISYSQIGRLTIVKMSVVPKLMYRFNAISIKIATNYFMDIDKLILETIRRSKKTQSSQHNTKEEQNWKTEQLNFKTYHKATVIKRVGFPGGSAVKNPPAMQETQEDPLEDGMATPCSILARKIPWTEETGRLQPIGSQIVRQDWSHWTCMHAVKSVWCWWKYRQIDQWNRIDNTKIGPHKYNHWQVER